MGGLNLWQLLPSRNAKVRLIKSKRGGKEVWTSKALEQETGT
jgi:hypothetical protein